MIDPELTDDLPALDDRTLRQFAALWLSVFGGLSLWNGYRGETAEALVFGVASLVVSLPGFVRPRSIRPIFLVLGRLTAPIGLMVTRVVLAVLFFGLFTPLALVFRVIGRDALHRHRADRSSYWTARSGSAHARRYFRQY